MVGIIRVATWNLGYGSLQSPSRNSTNKVRAALEYMSGKGVDIVIAQEIFNPNSIQDIYPHQIYSEIPHKNPSGTGVWGNIDFSTDAENNGNDQKWGTAVLAKSNFHLEKFVPDGNKCKYYNTAYPGSVTIAQIANTDIAIISMYGKKIYDYEWVTNYSYLANLHRCLSDMAPLLDRFYSPKRFIIAGDWNASPQFDTRTSSKNYNFFERLVNFDLKDCLGHFPDGNYETTYKNSGQLDWMFASKKLIIKNSYVDYSKEVEDLSDHRPIITEIELEEI